MENKIEQTERLNKKSKEPKKAKKIIICIIKQT